MENTSIQIWITEEEKKVFKEMSKSRGLSISALGHAYIEQAINIYRADSMIKKCHDLLKSCPEIKIDSENMPNVYTLESLQLAFDTEIVERAGRRHLLVRRK